MSRRRGKFQEAKVNCRFVTDKIMPIPNPKDIHVLIPRPCEYTPTCQGRIKVGDENRLLIRDLNREIILDHSACPQVITKVLK